MAKGEIYKYWIEECFPTMENGFCQNWETGTHTEKTECNRIDHSEILLCEKAILSSEETPTNPRHNAVFVKRNSTHAWQRRIP